MLPGHDAGTCSRELWPQLMGSPPEGHPHSTCPEAAVWGGKPGPGHPLFPWPYPGAGPASSTQPTTPRPCVPAPLPREGRPGLRGRPFSAA